MRKILINSRPPLQSPRRSGSRERFHGAADGHHESHAAVGRAPQRYDLPSSDTTSFGHGRRGRGRGRRRERGRGRVMESTLQKMYRALSHLCIPWIASRNMYIIRTSSGWNRSLSAFRRQSSEHDTITPGEWANPALYPAAFRCNL